MRQDKKYIHYSVKGDLENMQNYKQTDLHPQKGKKDDWKYILLYAGNFFHNNTSSNQLIIYNCSTSIFKTDISHNIAIKKETPEQKYKQSYKAASR